MGNISFKLKKFLQNKNTVTFIGLALCLAIVYFAYNWRINQAITPVKVPYAKVTIQPRTKITEDMIGYVEVLPTMVNSDTLKNVQNIVGKWSNYNTLIPKGSLFYKTTIVSASELPDAALIGIPDGYVPFNLNVNTNTTYGNSIFPGNYIDLYLKALDQDGKPMVGKLIENVKVLAVKDKNGKHVFENSEEERTPAIVIFAVPADIHILLRNAVELSNVKTVATELIPVPNNEAYKPEQGALNLTSTALKNFIELNVGLIPEDQLPSVQDPTEEQ